MKEDIKIETASKSPVVSVLMPVYNGEKYLREAIDSILAQTFTDFEFIIINDGSTDKTEEIILSYSDLRIHYFKNEKNLGIVGTLNRGLDLCKGKYIARMDADDVSLPERFEKQVVFMENHPSVVACGCLYAIYGKENKGAVDVATDADDVRMDMALYCQYAHSTLMLRRNVLEDNRLRYREEYRHAEDYKLWTELLRYGDMVNVPNILHKIRQCEEGISVVYSKEQKQLADRVRKDYLQQMGIETEHTLNEVLEGKLATEQILDALIKYYPLILRCKPYNWIRRNYLSALKMYARQLSSSKKLCVIRQFGKVLTTKDKVSILFR